MSASAHGWRGPVGKGAAGLLVTLVVLLALEGAARLLPLERWEREAPNTSYPLFVAEEGGRGDRYYVNGHYQGVVAPGSFARVKPPGVRRIFAVGGSAARGWPWPGEGSFTGYLQRALDQAAPGRFELVNAGAMSYASHRVLDLLHDVVAMEPDAVVIWSGNNEYVERNVLPPLARNAQVRGLHRVLRGCALYRVIRLGLHATVPSLFARADGPDLTDPRHDPAVRRGMVGRSAEVDRQVLENYRDNLRGMVRLVRESGAQPILCTVPVNLARWVPAGMPPKIEDPQLAARWRALQEASLADFAAGRYASAIPALQEMLAVTPGFPAVHYMLGECYRSSGRLVEARAAFDRARDLDRAPIRAFSTFEQVIREVAREEQAILVDLEQGFMATSGAELMGLDLFLDYVHPNERGQKLAAELVLAGILPLLAPDLDAGRIAERIRADDWAARARYRRADTDYVLGMTYQNNGDLESAEQAYLRALQENPEFPEPAGNLGLVYDQLGKPELAEKYLRQAIAADPATNHKLNLALVLYRQGRRAEAGELAARMLAQGVVDINLFGLLGDLARDAGHFAEAAGHYRQALATGDDSPELQAKLAEVLRRAGGAR